MARLDEIGERDGWRCWLCDEPVDPHRSANDDLGPSVDARITDRRAKSKSKSKSKSNKGQGDTPERLAHRMCNTGKGNTEAVIAWSTELFVIDPSPILPSVERLMNKGGREVMTRCPTRDDADQTATWLVDRIGRLEPALDVVAEISEGGGQYLVALQAT